MVHSISAVVLGVTLIVSQGASSPCAQRTFCWSPRVFQSMESQLGYVLFESVFSAFKAKHFVMSLGAAEDILFMLVLLFQRVRFVCICAYSVSSVCLHSPNHTGVSMRSSYHPVPLVVCDAGCQPVLGSRPLASRSPHAPLALAVYQRDAPHDSNGFQAAPLGGARVASVPGDTL